MKKLIRLSAFFLAILLLAGCSGSGYRYVDKGENSYITGIPAAEKHPFGGSTLAPEVRFSSVAEMKQDIKRGNFTEAEQAQMGKFYHNEKNQIEVFSLSDLQDATYPTSLTLDSIIWGGGKCYSFMLTSPAYADCSSTIMVIGQETFDYYMEHRTPNEENGRQTIHSVNTISDRNAMVYSYSGPGGTFKTILYTIVEENRTLHVEEHYYANSPFRPFYVGILLEQGTTYANIYISNPPSRPSMDEIKAFGLVKFK